MLKWSCPIADFASEQNMAHHEHSFGYIKLFRRASAAHICFHGQDIMNLPVLM